jgi:heterodisulfide reductase subunit C
MSGDHVTLGSHEVLLEGTRLDGVPFWVFSCQLIFSQCPACRALEQPSRDVVIRGEGQGQAKAKHLDQDKRWRCTACEACLEHDHILPPDAVLVMPWGEDTPANDA